MEDKSALIHHLDALLRILKEQADPGEFDEILRAPHLPRYYWYASLHHRLKKIEAKLDSLTDRPVATCRMACAEGENMIQLMTGIGIPERNKGTKFLSDWLGELTTLAIADPYLIKNIGAISEQDYKTSLENLLPLSLRELEVFIGLQDDRYQKTSIALWFNDLCKKRRIVLKAYHQLEIHDRVWIKGEKDLLVVGTSFNGLGNKCTFLLTPDSTDIAHFQAELCRIRRKIPSKAEV